MSWIPCYIALGSSLEPRAKTLASARQQLKTLPYVRAFRASRVHETLPVGPAQHTFFNQVAELLVDIDDPIRVLDDLLHIEKIHGRTRHIRWEDRTLDLDLLFFGNCVLSLLNCTLPHPRLHERDFVLAPLAELAPDFMHPLLHLSITELLIKLKTPTTLVRVL